MAMSKHTSKYHTNLIQQESHRAYDTAERDSYVIVHVNTKCGKCHCLTYHPYLMSAFSRFCQTVEIFDYLRECTDLNNCKYAQSVHKNSKTVLII